MKQDDLFPDGRPPPSKMQGSAALAFDDTCRLWVGRIWDKARPMAAWLLCNPSDADAFKDDQSIRRMCHFSRVVGCGGLFAVNYRPWRTPKPAELWRAIAAGRVTEAMMLENDAAIEAIAVCAQVHFIATGVEPPRRERAIFDRALSIFSDEGTRPLLCLGTSADGWPLHPLARGKFAIRNDRQPTPWECPT